MNNKTLARYAIAARRLSISPYSRFRVGAALLTANGKVVTGCNIECSSYSLTMCAERTALFKALSDGDRRFLAIAIASDTHGLVSPCGACRQALFELAGDIEVILVTPRGRMRSHRLSALLPFPFTDHDVRKKRS